VGERTCETTRRSSLIKSSALTIPPLLTSDTPPTIPADSGGALSGREQRRLAAIVAADVVGYSRLMGRDEAGTVVRLRNVRTERLAPTVARRGGRIVKLTGDGALVEFSSAVEALSAAIEFQLSMAESEAERPEAERIVFRLGVHLGDVIVDDDDLYGDGVNVAARLEAKAPAGGIVISGDMYNVAAPRVAATFEDLGRLTLKNIERPVQAYAVRWEANNWPVTAPAAMVESVLSAPSPEKLLPLPDKPSIAVLPFQNMSGDPEQEYFADGIVEDIITALSRFKSLFVIARNSSFTYKGRAVDIKQIGRELGVRYVLEGSVRKVGNRIRITGQLLDTASGAHLWAEKIDGEYSDVFELQDRITTRVVSSIAPTIENAEIERLKQRPTNSADSYDTYLRAVALQNLGRYPEARSLFKKATEQNPEFAAAYAASARTYSLEQAFNGIIPTPEVRADALRDIEAALSITNDDALVLAGCSHPTAYICQQFDRGALLADRSIMLNSNLATAWRSRGWVSLMVGKPEQAIESFGTLLQLSPLDPARPNAMSGIAFGYLFLDRYDEGRRLAGEALQLVRDHQSFASYIANCVGVGDSAEAKRAAAQFLKYDPDFSVLRASAIYPMRLLQHRQRIDDALRAAGVPE
jgi:TolB-like protein/class 3 adenylate cyclase